jgi:hypothetical protein
MISFAVCRVVSCRIAGSEWKQGRLGEAGEGLRDKSADVRRAHVVGWYQDLRSNRRSPAGASDGISREIKPSSAIAHFQQDLIGP